MTKMLLAVTCALVIAHDAMACAMFTISDGDTVFFANNEDATSAGEIWFEPAAKGRLGRVNLGWDDFTQGAMNEAGLCFDAAALPKVPYTPDANKKDTRNLLEVIMDQCRSVEEALAMFDTYNCTHLADGQFMFADASGAAAVVTWDPAGRISIVRKQGSYQLITNDRLEWSGLRDERFALADRLLHNAAKPTLELCTHVLDGIHQEGKDAFTTYSNVFEPRTRTIHLFRFADYANSVRLVLADELAKGRHKVELRDLFPKGVSIEDYRARPRRIIPSEISLDSEKLAAFVGAYEATNPDVRIDISLREGKLLFAANGQRAVEIFPESETAFRFRDTFGTLSFARRPDGEIEGLTLHRPRDHFARRMP